MRCEARKSVSLFYRSLYSSLRSLALFPLFFISLVFSSFLAVLSLALFLGPLFLYSSFLSLFAVLFSLVLYLYPPTPPNRQPPNNSFSFHTADFCWDSFFVVALMGFTVLRRHSAHRLRTGAWARGPAERRGVYGASRCQGTERCDRTPRQVCGRRRPLRRWRCCHLQGRRGSEKAQCPGVSAPKDAV